MLDAVRAAGLRTAVVSSSKNCLAVITAAGIAERAGGFGLVVGVDRAGQAAALVEHGADVVVEDLAVLAP